jgi:hypothetical protein
MLYERRQARRQHSQQRGHTGSASNRRGTQAALAAYTHAGRKSRQKSTPSRQGGRRRDRGGADETVGVPSRRVTVQHVFSS